jgi:hypothetical protein
VFNPWKKYATVKFYDEEQQGLSRTRYWNPAGLTVDSGSSIGI